MVLHHCISFSYGCYRKRRINQDWELLENLIKKGSDWRERGRAKTILLLAEEHTTFDVSEKQGVLPETVRERRRKWLKKGFASLPNQSRSEASSKLIDEHRAQLKEWIDAEPLTSRALVNRLKIDCGIGISAGTLRNELKQMVCVETDALQFKKKRDPERFEQAQRDIEELIAQAQTGAIELAYVDEAGFAPQPPNRSAWTKSGKTHAITATRAQRLNVIGALLSSGQLIMAKLWQSVNGLWFFAFLMAMLEKGRLTVPN